MVDGMSSLQPRAWTLVHLQLKSCCLTCHRLQYITGVRSSSSSARRETSSAKSRSVKVVCLNDTPNWARFDRPSQSIPVVNESAANTQPWRTPVSIWNHELWIPPARTQLAVLSYRTLNSLTIFSGVPSLVKSNHNAGLLRQSKASRRSTNAEKVGWPKSCLHCAMLHKVAMRSQVKRPGVNLLCWGRLCDSKVDFILARMTCANTFPNTDRRVIPL